MALVPYKGPVTTSLFGGAGAGNDGKSGSLLGQRNNVSGAQTSGLFQPKKSSFGGPSPADTGVP